MIRMADKTNGGDEVNKKDFMALMKQAEIYKDDPEEDEMKENSYM